MPIILDKHMKPSLPADGNHALLIGNLIGMMMTLGDIVETKIDVVMIGNDYSNQIILKRPSGEYLLTVEKIEEPS